ncbi:hypothetical protein SAMN05444678_101218 [Sphingomonas sp. YR710]|uniref:homogentisate 1,2-dioxygenase n=1 Tax=Sphingomonas sp. YR710 TaxID=1882773 RepID=UPI000881903A|nr:homogentisate 1,2-dioxygenase [Sphingomonas sp. YR710]SDC04812.1 hypothetical protein SAMN05444678_101218 [Sphingomonas sp. YR710]
MMPLSEVRAQADDQRCAAGPATLPAELAGWTSRHPIMAAGAASGTRAAPLEIETAADATLRPTSEMRYVTSPEKPGDAASYGGLFAFTVQHAGTYRVALGAGAWIDVLSGTKAIASTAHGHGPDCSGIRKIVDFALEPGSYILQVAGSGKPALPLMIARAP